MDNFKIVLIILAVFFICCYLKNNSLFTNSVTVVEGNVEAQRPSSWRQGMGSGSCAATDSSIPADVAICDAVVNDGNAETCTGAAEGTVCTYTPDTNLTTRTRDRRETTMGLPDRASERPAIIDDAYNQTGAGKVSRQSITSVSDVPRQQEGKNAGPSNAANEKVLNVISRPGGGLCKQTQQSFDIAVRENGGNSDGIVPTGEYLPGNWDEGSCTGKTGYKLEWVKFGNRDGAADGTRRKLLQDISPPVGQNILRKEDAVEPLDIFSNSAQGEYKFQYRDLGTGMITEQNQQVPLIPLKDTAYCMNLDGSENTNLTNTTNTEIENAISNETPLDKTFYANTISCAPTKGPYMWIDPKMSSRFPSGTPFERYRQNKCGISLDNGGPGDGSTAAGGQPDCLEKQNLYIPHCVSNDGLQIQPKDWWKERWDSGDSIETVCEGDITGREWQESSELAGLLDGKTIDYMAARHGTSIDSTAAREDIAATKELRDVVFQDLQKREKTSAEASQQLAELRQDIQAKRQAKCFLEKDIEGNPYIGNFVTSWGGVSGNDISGSDGNSGNTTAGGYLFQDNDVALQAENLEEISRKVDGSRNTLTCNPINFMEDPDSAGVPTVDCPDSGSDTARFQFRGCIPKTCKMPQEMEPGQDGWHPTHYRWRNIDNVGDVHGSNVTENSDLTGYKGANSTGLGTDDVYIGNFVDMRDGTPLLECNPETGSSLAPGFDSVRVTCNTNNGEISIQGCMPNRCKTPAQVAKTDIAEADNINHRRRYHINSTYDDEFVDINTFKKTNQWATSTGDIGGGILPQTTVSHWGLNEATNAADSWHTRNPDNSDDLGGAGHRFSNRCASTEETSIGVSKGNTIANTSVQNYTMGTPSKLITNVPLIREEDYHTDETHFQNILGLTDAQIDVDRKKKSVATYSQPCFSCAAPNHYKVNDGDNERGVKARAAWTEESTPHTLNKNFTYGANALCSGNEGTFELSGCFENKCYNPYVEGSKKVYDGEKRDFVTGELEKPQWLGDTLTVANYEATDDISGLYQKYQRSFSSESGNENEKPGQIAGDEITHRKFAQKSDDGTSLKSLKCGINYSSIAQPNSRDIGHSNVKCYNIFDWRNAVDPDNKDIPNYHTGSNGVGSNPDEDGSEPNPTYFQHVGTEPENKDVERYHPNTVKSPNDIVNETGNIQLTLSDGTNKDFHHFTVSGCEENYCRWPRVNSTTADGANYVEPSEKPRNRVSLHTMAKEEAAVGEAGPFDSIGGLSSDINQDHPIKPVDATDGTGTRGILGYYTNYNTKAVGNEKNPGSGSEYTRGVAGRSEDERETAQNSNAANRGMLLPGGEGGGDNNIYKKGTEIFTASEWANIPYTGIHNDGLTTGWDHTEEVDGEQVAPAGGEDKGFVNAGNENMSYSIECIGDDRLPENTGTTGQGKCIPGTRNNIEPEYKNYEIDVMLKEAWLTCEGLEDETAKSSCKAKLIKGQPYKINGVNDDDTVNKTPLNSQDLLEVGRGGPFTISRCWRRNTIDVKPNVKCERTTESVNGGCKYTRKHIEREGNKASCSEAKVSGCKQNKCKLSTSDAQNGTRLLIETSDGQYATVGGATSDGMEIEFNVDQIRRVTCDYNFSKIDPSKTFGHVWCDTDGGNLLIQNPCNKTKCGVGATTPLNKIKIVDTQHIRTPGYSETNNEVTASGDKSVTSRPPGRNWTDKVQASSGVGSATENLATFHGGSSTWGLNKDSDQPYIIGDSLEPVGGIYQGHFDDLGNKDIDITTRNNGTALGLMYNVVDSNKIMPNYNKDWSRYMSDTTDANHVATNIYDKYNYSRKYGTEIKPNIPEGEFTKREGASGFGAVGNDGVVNVTLSGNSADSTAVTNWKGTTHPLVKCNTRSPKSLNAFGGVPGSTGTTGKTLAEVNAMYGEPEETGSLGVSSNRLGATNGHAGYCTYKVDDNGYVVGDPARVTGDEATPADCAGVEGEWITTGRLGVASCNLERGTITQTELVAELNQPTESRPEIPSNYNITSPGTEDLSKEGQPTKWNEQPYKVSHCQRSICQYPQINMASADVSVGVPETLGYKYIGRAGGSTNADGVFVGGRDSVSNVLGYERGGTGDVALEYDSVSGSGSRSDTDGNIVDVGTGIVRGRTTSTHSPYSSLYETAADGRVNLSAAVTRSEFYNDQSIYRDKHGSSLQCDNTNFSGTPNIKCNQGSDQYLTGTVPVFSNFTGCYENSCIIPSPSALERSGEAVAADTTNSTPRTWAAEMYNGATRAEKEKWDRVERGYEFFKPTVYENVQGNGEDGGKPFPSSKLKKATTTSDGGTPGLNTDPKHDKASIDFKCNRNFRANSSNPQTIRCPSKDPGGLQPYWVESDSSENRGGWIPNTDNGTLPANDPGSQYGIFTNLYSSKPLNSTEEHNHDQNDSLSGSVAGLNTNEGSIVNSAQCVENKCLLNDTIVDVPPLIGDTGTPTDNDFGGDILFDVRRQCKDGDSTGLETTAQECSDAGGTFTVKNEREKLHPEIEGYEFRLYNNQLDGTASSRGDDAGNAKVGYCSGEGSAKEKNTLADCTGAGGTWNPYKLWEQHDVFTSGDTDGGTTSSLSEDDPAKSRDRGFMGYYVNPNTGDDTINSELSKHVASNPGNQTLKKVTAHYLSPLQDYGAVAQGDSISESHSIRCAPNYHVSKNKDLRTDFQNDASKPEDNHMRGSSTGIGPLVTCEGSNDTSDDSNTSTDNTTKFNLTGCSENYCKLPNESNRNTSMYTYTDNKKTELENLSENQNGKITLRQFNHGGPTLRCAPWTTGTPNVACNWGGLESTGKKATAGTCSVEQTDSGTGRKIPYLTRETCEAASGVWTPEQTQVDMTEARTATGDVPEFTYTGCIPLVRQEPEGTTYYEPYPGDCVGYWPGSLSHISDDGSGQTISPPDQLDEQARDTAMFRFYNQCKRNCDNNLKCSGFTIQKLGRDEAAASGADEGTMLCNQKTSESPGGITENAGPADQRCRLETRSQSSWAKNWGYDNIYKDFEMNPTTAAQMGLINSATDAPPTVTTVRWQIIPDDQPIYFEKKYTPGVDGEQLGGTPQDQTPSSLRNPPTTSATAVATCSGTATDTTATPNCADAFAAASNTLATSCPDGCDYEPARNTIGGSGSTVGQGGLSVATGGGIAR